MTEESARLAKKYGLRKASKTGLSTGVVQGKKKAGQIGTFLEFVKGPRALLNPATVSGVAGLMAQVAMEQALGEITDYLASIDEKVDEVLRNQKDAELSRLIGAGTVIKRAMTIRAEVAGVPETLWSTVQDKAGVIGTAQGYALGQLKKIAERLERQTSVRGLARTAKGAEPEVREWLAVPGSLLPAAGPGRPARIGPDARGVSGPSGGVSPRIEG